MIQPLFWRDNRLLIVDQTLLPHEYRLIEIHDHIAMAEALRRLAVRGAPAIGIAAAFGLVVGLRSSLNLTPGAFQHRLCAISDVLRNTRPTAVNLFHALERMEKCAVCNRAYSNHELWERLLAEAQAIHSEDIAMCQRIAETGLGLLPDPVNIMTHCNAGGLATGGLGTALGIIIHAHHSGRQVHVFVNETRPLLQGTRLTAWELQQEGVPFTICTDNSAAHLMQHATIQLVLTGADRIAANGDSANKIGTYALAILARHHRIPFYIAAPSTTIDPAIPTGLDIPIEERPESEVLEFAGIPVAPSGSRATAPAFDVTPAGLIEAIITEDQIFYAPFHFVL